MNSAIADIEGLVVHSGALTRTDVRHMLKTGELLLNNAPTQPTQQIHNGDLVTIRSKDYRAVAGGGQSRLQLISEPLTDSAGRISGPIRVHAGYHKCLTEYTKKIYRRLCRAPILRNASFHHYFHRLDAFYNDCHNHRLCSVSGQHIDLQRFADIRVVRFIRDPRDLLVSGYFYHRRGAEHWCELPNPNDIDWLMVNGAVPTGLPEGMSLTGYLNNISLEEGLLAEMEFRRHHFTSMRQWPISDPRIRLFKYEDIIGRESEIFGEIFRFFELPVARVLPALTTLGAIGPGKKAASPLISAIPMPASGGNILRRACGKNFSTATAISWSATTTH